jgi:hypothetical protein
MLIVFNATFQQYFSYIMPVSIIGGVAIYHNKQQSLTHFICGGNRNTRRKPQL